MSISHRRRWLSSERIAIRFLEEHGYRVIDRNVSVKISDVDVSEVDAIVEDRDGVRYAVEVKAGKIDVNGIRQAYVNAELLGLKPLIIAKGFSDERAERLAEKLGVKVIQLSDYFLVNAEELEIIIREALEDTLNTILSILVSALKLGDEDIGLIEKIVESGDLREFAEKIGVKPGEAWEIINRFRGKGIIPQNARSFRDVKTYLTIAYIVKRITGSR